MKRYNIAVIEGDGIGLEVLPEGLRVLEAAGRRHDISFSWQHFDWSCQRYLKTGRMMPADAIDQLRGFDAIYLAAMPQHLGELKAARTVEKAFEAVLARQNAHTPDLGGRASTRDVGDAVAHEVTLVAEP